MAAATVVNVVVKKNQYAQRYLDVVGAANVMDNSGLQDIFIIDVAGLCRVGIDLVVATNALAAFAIQGLFSENSAAYRTLRNTAGQFTSPTGILVDSSGDLTVSAVGSTGWFIIDCAGISKIKIQANSGNAGGSSLAIAGSGL